MKNLRVARRYAMALMREAEQAKQLEAVATDLTLIGTLLKESREFRLFVASPVVSEEKKRAVFRELLASRVSAATMTFIHLLMSKNREGILPEVVEQFQILLDDKMGIVNIDVKAAVVVTGEQEKDLRQQLEKRTGKRVRIRVALDTSITGGMVIRIGDTVLDASLRHQLEVLKQRFVEGDAALN